MRRNPNDDDENNFTNIFNQLNNMLGDASDSDPVDVHEYDEEIRVVADLPDADQNDIALQCDGRTLTIQIAQDPVPQIKQIDLPDYVDAQSADMSFNNGILEVTLERDTDPANIGFY